MIKVLKYSFRYPGGDATVTRELIENAAAPEVGDIDTFELRGVPYTVRVDAVHEAVTVDDTLQIRVVCSLGQKLPKAAT